MKVVVSQKNPFIGTTVKCLIYFSEFVQCSSLTIGNIKTKGVICMIVIFALRRQCSQIGIHIFAPTTRDRCEHVDILRTIKQKRKKNHKTILCSR